MSNEECEKVLKELDEVRPEKLNDKAKRLFEAMMKIADERDSVKADLYEANNRINDLLDIVKQKDKEIECLNIIHESYKEMVKENNYISKDKIKAKILECRKILYSFEKELELKANKEKYIHKESMNCLLSQISILQSLLEKE